VPKLCIAAAALAIGVSQPASADEVSDVIEGLVVGVGASPALVGATMESAGYECRHWPEEGVSLGCINADSSVAFTAHDSPITLNSFWIKNSPHFICAHFIRTVTSRRGPPVSKMHPWSFWLLPRGKALMIGIMNGACSVGVGWADQ